MKAVGLEFKRVFGLEFRVFGRAFRVLDAGNRKL